jgi:hypothetical protein
MCDHNWTRVWDGSQLVWVCTRCMFRMGFEEELQVIQQDHDRVVRAHGVPKRVPGVKRNHTHSTPWTRGTRTEVKAA